MPQAVEEVTLKVEVANVEELGVVVAATGAPAATLLVAVVVIDVAEAIDDAD